MMCFSHQNQHELLLVNYKLILGILNCINPLSAQLCDVLWIGQAQAWLANSEISLQNMLIVTEII